jgi:hypothetical protein
MLQAVRSPVLILDVNGFFSWASLSSHTMTLELTSTITEMITRNIPGGKMAAGVKS